MAPRKVNKTDPRNVAKPVSQLRGAAKQARITKVTRAEAGPATVRGGMAPGAGRSKPIGTGGGGVTKPSALGTVARRAGLAAVAAEGLTARNTADGTLSAAMRRGDYKPQQGPKPKTTQASFNKKTFNDAFRSARLSGAKTFTWRGKKYTTEMK